MTPEEREELIAEAAQECFEQHVEPDIEPVARYLQAVCHDYGANWGFCLCVAWNVADLEAQAEGYEDQCHRAWEKMVERKGQAWVHEHLGMGRRTW